MPRAAGDAPPPETTLHQGHFDALYAQNPDPWGLSSAWYEQRKYAITLASLPREHYRHAFEAGCAVGQFTAMLAPRCAQLLAVDFAAAAVELTRARVADFHHVKIERATLPRQLPDARFDLIVASEILYYFSEGDLELVLDGLMERLEPDGDLVAVHHRAADRCYGYDGFNVHERLARRPGLHRLTHHEDSEFVLDVFRSSNEGHGTAPTNGTRQSSVP